jgi:hypothetical protein
MRGKQSGSGTMEEPCRAFDTKPSTTALESEPVSETDVSQEAEIPIQTKPKVILKLSCLRELICAANMGDCRLVERKGQCVAHSERAFWAHATTGPQVKPQRTSGGHRAYPIHISDRIVLQRSRPRRGGESSLLPQQKISNI